MNIDNWEQFFLQFPHGLIVIKDDHIIHAVGYPQPATRVDIDNLVQEFKDDPELGLTYLRDYTITPLSGEEWKKYLMIYTGEPA